MEKNEIKDYIEKLKEFEKKLTTDLNDSVDKDLDDLLKALSGEVEKEIKKTSNTLNVKIKKMFPQAVIPTYSKKGDAGMDIVSTNIKSNTLSQIVYGTGLCFEIPPGYVCLIFPRSSIRKYGLTLSNSVGVLDSGYRGELEITFNKQNQFSPIYDIGDRVAQLIIVPYPTVNFIESDELSDSERGEGGHGSTGF